MSQTDFDTVKKDEGKCYLRTECLYDDYFNNLIQTLKGLSPMEVDEFLDAESEKGNIEMRIYNYVLYRYKEFYITSGYIIDEDKLVKGYEIVNGLNLTTFPQLVEWHNTLGIVTMIPGNTGKNIVESPKFMPGYDNEKIQNSARCRVIDDLKKLESNGYMLSRRNLQAMRINDNGNIIIPYCRLVPVPAAKSIEQIYHAVTYMLENGLNGLC